MKALTIKMKKDNNDKKRINDSENLLEEKPLSKEEEMNTIQEFIELKKLQNRILSKMLEKNIPAKTQNKISISNTESTKTK